MLGVTTQTIQNWCSKGLLAHRNMRGSAYNISRESVVKRQDELTELGRQEKDIENYRIKITSKQKELKRTLQHITAELHERQLVPQYVQALATHITAYLRMMRGQVIGDNEAAVLISVVEGKSYEDIARMNQVTREAVRQTAQRAFRQLYRLPLYAELLDEAARLRNENIKLRHATKGLLNRVERYEAISEEQAKQLGMSVWELPLSIRVQNCLRTLGVNTVDDLCQMTPRELMNIRNFGRKCLWEIEDALDELGLKLKGN